MTNPVEAVRQLYAAVTTGDRAGIAASMAPQMRWRGRDRGPRWLRRSGCAGADDHARQRDAGRALPRKIETAA